MNCALELTEYCMTQFRVNTEKRTFLCHEGPYFFFLCVRKVLKLVCTPEILSRGPLLVPIGTSSWIDYQTAFKLKIKASKFRRIDKVVKERQRKLQIKCQSKLVKIILFFRESTVSNKNTHLAAFETCVFRVYLRNHLSYKKVIHVYQHPCLKSFQIIANFSNPATKSADICKNAVFP